jgi:RNA polymerase sigma factor (TIGR02999 family)
MEKGNIQSKAPSFFLFGACDMQGSDNVEITQILNDLESTDQATAFARLLPLVYTELRALSERYLRQERPDHTLQATALVHEAYVRLAGHSGAKWDNRAHFFRVAAKVMRRILINHALARRAAKRGSGQSRVALDEVAVFLPDSAVDVLDLHDALEELAIQDRQKARVVELRFFAGCTIDETAEALGISTATVERDWRFARAWLRKRIGAAAQGSSGDEAK